MCEKDLLVEMEQRLKNRERAKKALYRSEKREKNRAYSAAWRLRNQEYLREKERLRRIEKRDEIRQKEKLRSQLPARREYMNRRVIARYKKDPYFRLSMNLRSRFYQLVTRKSWKFAKTFEFIGCPVSGLRGHLESLFRPGMTWENYGPVWHIDHIRPCASFDLSDVEQQKVCFHWTNLQPLFTMENIMKGAKVA